MEEELSLRYLDEYLWDFDFEDELIINSGNCLEQAKVSLHGFYLMHVF